MKCKRRRSARDEVARKEWDEKAAQWDGIALAWHPGLKRLVDMEWYKATGAERIMARLDSLPPYVREAVYNGPDGNIDNTLRRLGLR